VRLYHPSDSDPFPEMESLARRGGPELLLYLGASVEKALQIVDLVGPQTLVSRYLEPMQLARRLEAEANGTRSAVLHPMEIFLHSKGV